MARRTKAKLLQVISLVNCLAYSWRSDFCVAGGDAVQCYYHTIVLRAEIIAGGLI